MRPGAVRTSTVLFNGRPSAAIPSTRRDRHHPGPQDLQHAEPVGHAGQGPYEQRFHGYSHSRHRSCFHHARIRMGPTRVPPAPRRSRFHRHKFSLSACQVRGRIVMSTPEHSGARPTTVSIGYRHSRGHRLGTGSGTGAWGGPGTVPGRDQGSGRVRSVSRGDGPGPGRVRPGRSSRGDRPGPRVPPVRTVASASDSRAGHNPRFSSVPGSSAAAGGGRI